MTTPVPTPTADPEPVSYLNPPLDCDLVMKGGITSGVVYPLAVLKLAVRYRFHAIGGSSSGAIAAGFTAAAEYGRENSGFEKLGALGKWLGAGHNLLDLFQAPQATRPLMATLTDILLLKDSLPQSPAPAQSRGSMSSPLAWFAWAWKHLPTIVRARDARAFLGGAWKGALALALMLFLLVMGIFGIFVALTGVVGGWWAWMIVALLLAAAAAWLGWRGGGLLASAAHLASLLLVTLPKQTFFGISTGHATPGDAQQRGELLTDWLCSNLNDVAGFSPDHAPLTFNDLNLGTHSIDLRFVTTNISQGQPYVLPRPAGKNAFVFDAAEWRQLFPASVVDYLIEHAPFKDMPLPADCYFLPQGDALPVIVAMRLSLSFPVLLSAIPLYTISASAYTAYHQAPASGQPFAFDRTNDLQLNLFSDGGLCSDFPIQFFDHWLPTHPTFGINLTTLPISLRTNPAGPHNTGIARSVNTMDGAPNGPADTVPKVFLPRPNDPQYPEWRKVSGLLGFVLAMFDSARNYRDTMQAQLPSYRERIVQIRLSPTEGGLNLAMPQDVIQGLEQRGAEAGEQLLNHFDFNHHRWVRLRVLLHQLEKHLAEIKAPLAPAAVTDLLACQRSDTPPGYPYRELAAAWSPAAEQRIDALRSLLEHWEQDNTAWFNAHSDAGAAPNATAYFFADPSSADPRPEMRVTPEL